MSNQKTVIQVNSNFHHVCGENLFKKNDRRFEEYRRKWSQWPKNFQAGGFPLFLDIEVTSSCNLQCPFCATTYRKNKIKQGFISFDLIKKIISEGAREGLYGVKFNIRGEPLLHPDLVEFVSLAKKSGLIDVYFNTNAMLLTKDISTKLIAAGLDRISISVEGCSREEYEKHRVGARFETLIKNIKGLRALRQKLGVSHPKIRIQTVMLPDSQVSFDEYRKFWSRYADEVGYLDYKSMKIKKKGITYPWACPQIWQRMAVWWDGTILPCNHDDNKLLELGNLKDISIKQAWHSERLNTVRKQHKKGMSHKIRACDGCYLRDSEIAKLIKNKNAKI